MIKQFKTRFTDGRGNIFKVNASGVAQRIAQLAP